MMLDCERWTLTHSSGGPVALLALLLLLPPLVAGLGSELGLAAA